MHLRIDRPDNEVHSAVGRAGLVQLIEIGVCPGANRHAEVREMLAREPQRTRGSAFFPIRKHEEACDAAPHLMQHQPDYGPHDHPPVRQMQGDFKRQVQCASLGCCHGEVFLPVRRG